MIRGTRESAALHAAPGRRPAGGRQWRTARTAKNSLTTGARRVILPAAGETEANVAGEHPAATSGLRDARLDGETLRRTGRVATGSRFGVPPRAAACPKNVPPEDVGSLLS